MTSITCPHCTRVGTLQVAVPPGTKIRCPACRETFAIPDDAPGPLATDDGYDPIIPPPANATPQPSSSGVSPPPPSIPPEPWYYGWIERLARGTWTLGRVLLIIYAILLALLVVGIVVVAVQHDSVQAAGPTIATCALAYLLLWASLLPTFLFAALLMLAVDAARNVRATRYR